MQRGAVVAQADVQAHLAERRLGPVGPTEPVPPGNRTAKVAVGLNHACGVMDTVHVRGHDKPAQPAVEALGQRHIAVIEDRRRVQENLEGHDRPRHGAQQHHHSRLEGPNPTLKP